MEFKLFNKDGYKLYEKGKIAIVFYKLDPDPESLAYLDIINASRINPKSDESLLEKLEQKSNMILEESSRLYMAKKALERGAGAEELKGILEKDGSEKAREALDKILNVLGHANIMEQSHALIAIVMPILQAMEMQDEAFIASQERSTRYVRFSEYYIPESISSNGEALNIYRGAIERLDEAYVLAMGTIEKKLVNEYTKESGREPDKEYIHNVIEPNARDIARALLPASKMTVVFFSTNAKNFEKLTKKMLASPNNVSRIVGDGLRHVIEDNMPSFSRHLSPDEFEEVYYRNVKKFSLYNCDSEVRGYDKEVVKLYGSSEEEMLESISKISGVEREKILDYIREATSHRKSKHDALNKTIFGVGSLLFEIDISMGSLRDLQRHRDTVKNYEIDDRICYFPKQLIESDEFEQINKAISEAALARKKLEEIGFGEEAKLLLPLATSAKFYMQMGLGEAIYIMENRSTKEAHPEYYNIAKKMKSAFEEKYPNILKNIKHFIGEEEVSRINKKGTENVNKEYLF
ncbi:MAG: FAD-dependent thymidylate synthase [Candidatus Micrarchaeia archaeon]